jgi:hypothetical protein
VLLFVSPHLRAELPPKCPLLEFNPSHSSIPRFYFQRREFHRGGGDKFDTRLMSSDGEKQPSQHLGCDPVSPLFWGAEFVAPSDGWKVRFRGDSAEKALAKGRLLTLDYRLDPKAEPKSFLIPSWGMTFAAEPLAFDDLQSRFYFTVSDGPVEERRKILLYLDLKDGELYEIGKTHGMEAQVSPDHQWILWSSGEIFTMVGDRPIQTWNLRIFNLARRESYVLTTGLSQNNFCAWEKGAK